MSSKVKPIYLFITLSLIPAACGSAGAQDTPEPIVETLVVTEQVQATPVEVIHVVTPTPEPEGPRTLVICLDEEPSEEQARNYFLFDNTATPASKFQQVVEDGPLEQNSFAYQPVILEKIPSLADGDAALTVVRVREGDTVVDADEKVVTLDPSADPPIMLIPAGGGDPVPYQGGEFELDQMTVTFKLLPDLMWSDGEPLTAMDSVYTYNLEVEPVFYFRDDLVPFTAAYEALDQVTIRWMGLPGYRNANYPTFFFRPRPEHIWSQYSPDEIVEAEELILSPVGWGPYMVAEWVPGQSITLLKNPNYFRREEGLPKFDRLILRIIGDKDTTNLAALLSGDCDLVSALLEDQMELLLELHEAGKLKATFTTGTLWEHIDFGIQHVDYDDGYQPGVDRPDFFSDVRMRQAFALCMDRQALVDTIYFGQSLVPDSYLPPQHPLFNPEVRHFEFDPVAGSALLEAVGWVDEDGDPETPRVAQGVPNVPDGTLLEVTYETTDSATRQQSTAIIQESLVQCGIKANIQLYSLAEWLQASGPEGKLWGRRFDLGQFTWVAEPSPPCHFYDSGEVSGPTGAQWISIQDGLERFFSSKWEWYGPNEMGFVDEEYDRVCRTARSSLPGQSEYEAAHREAQRIFSEQLPSVPLYMRIKVSAMRPDMCGVIMDPSSDSELWNIEEFDYGEGCQE